MAGLLGAVPCGPRLWRAVLRCAILRRIPLLGVILWRTALQRTPLGWPTLRLAIMRQVVIGQEVLLRIALR